MFHGSLNFRCHVCIQGEKERVDSGRGRLVSDISVTFFLGCKFFRISLNRLLHILRGVVEKGHNSVTQFLAAREPRKLSRLL